MRVVNDILVDEHINGSFTLFYGRFKKTYYGYTLNDAIKRFKQEVKA